MFLVPYLTLSILLQGSGFILIIGKGSCFRFVVSFTQRLQVIINYRWARNPKLLTNNLDKAIALLTTSIYWVTALWYAKEGDKITSSLVTFVGGLQLWSTFFAIK